MRDFFDNIATFVIVILTISIVTMSMVSLLSPTNHSQDKIFKSCKLTGTYYFEENRAIKCEVIEK